METFFLWVLLALIAFAIFKLTKKKRTVDVDYDEPYVDDTITTIDEPIYEKVIVETIAQKPMVFDFDYVVIDFEYADKQQFACQLGIVPIKNNEIVGSVDFVIQPPDNKYGVIESKIHGLNSEKTKDSPTFLDLWGEIYPYFQNQVIVCHNSVTDITVLNKTCAYYNLHVPRFKVIDTIDVFGKVKLTLLAESFGVKFTNHHNALSDAYVLAEIFILHKKGYNPVILKSEDSKKNRNVQFSERNISRDLLVPDLDVENKENPFYNKSVVITGLFDCFSRNDIASKFKSIGANVNASVSKRTNYVIIGEDAGPAKLEKIDKLNSEGANITLLDQHDLENIFNDVFDDIEENIK